MRTFSGLLLDPYDDPSRALLHAVYPDPGRMPEEIKVARDLSGKLDHLPDTLFALCMRNEGEALRKFAMVDRGNTALSTLYFLKTAGLLPDKAQQHAAANLVKAAGWYDLPVDETLKKIAFGMAALKGVGALGAAAVKDPVGAFGKAMTGMSVLGAGKAVAGNLRGAAQAGGAIQPLSSFQG